MYFGNVSDFFYRTKSWLSRQPKFSLNQMDNQNIVKMGSKYYKVDNVTGTLEIINNDSFTPKTKKSRKIKNNTEKEDLNKRNAESLPEITINSNSNKNSDATFKNKTKKRLNSLTKPPILSMFEDNNEGNNLFTGLFNNDLESNNNKNQTTFSFNKTTEEYIKPNIKDNKSYQENLGQTSQSYNKNFTFNSHFNNYKKKRSIFLNTSNNFTKGESIENNKSVQNKRTKNKLYTNPINIKKHSPLKYKLIFGKKESFNSTKISNNWRNHKKLEKSKKKFNFPTSIKKNYNKQLNKKQNYYENIDENELIGRIFPNEESLNVNENDNKLIAKIKDQLYQDRLYDGLRKKFHFYHEKKARDDNLNVPRLKIKNLLTLCKFEYKNDKEPIHRKIYFEYVNKQRKCDNELFGLDYPINEKYDIKEKKK